jgi:CubicO group peptidase (beta-lactamase class C family)
MMFRRFTAAAMMALLASAAPAMAREAVPASQAQVFAQLSDVEVARRVQAVVDEIRARPEFVGLSVAVARGDRVIIDEGVGMADLEWNAPAGANTVMRIGSVTKQFTAAAIMKLNEQGKIGLDDPVTKYLPDFDTQGHTVTIRQMLNHTSGIPNYTAQKGFAEKAARLDMSEQGVIELIAGVPFDFEPGTKWAYSNTNFFLLGMIVEKLSGQSYADFMRDRFFKPLGLTHIRFDDLRAIVPERARGYTFDPSVRMLTNATFVSTSWAGGAGGLLSTAGDLVRWQIALTGGRAISRVSFQQMIGSAVQTGPNSSYGFGLGIDRFAGQPRISHGGGINGFNSNLAWLPEAGLSVAVISNVIGLPSDLVAARIETALTSEKPLPPLRVAMQPGGEAFLRKLIADQANATIDFSTMTEPMADLVRAHPAQDMFRSWGSITKVTFLEVGLNGLDSYRVDFDSGASWIFNIFREPHGKLATMTFFPAAPPIGS